MSEVKPGDRVLVRNFTQPTSQPGDPERQPGPVYAGDVSWVSGRAVGLPDAPGGWVPTWPTLASDGNGPARWNVTEVTPVTELPEIEPEAGG